MKVRQTTTPVRPATLSPELWALGAARPEQLRMGTSSWSFPGWAGLVYADQHSESQLAREGLPAYAAHPLFQAVGIDRTFYAPLTSAQFAEYATAVPDDFRFIVKAHDVCTFAQFPAHARFGAQASKPNRNFLDPGYASEQVIQPAIEGLGNKLGSVVFQISPQPVPSVGGALGFAERLATFLAALPKGPTYGVELRSPALLTKAYREALKSVGASHVFAGHPSMPDIRQQLDRLLGYTGPTLLIRWLLHRGLSYTSAGTKYAPFDRIQDPDDASVQIIRQLVKDSSVTRTPTYVLVGNTAEGSAPKSIERLAIALAGL